MDGYVYVKEMDAICPVVLLPERILMFVATGPEHHQYASRLETIGRALKKATWHYQYLDDPVPGIYASILFLDSHHKDGEPPVEFLRRITGLTIDDRDPHLRLFHS